jgi:alpha-N-arabinofuranosidase
MGGWYDVEPGTNPGFLFQQNTMRDAMIAGVTLNVFNNHADRVRIANLAQCVNVLQAVILTKEEKLILNAHLPCHGNVQCSPGCNINSGDR